MRANEFIILLEDRADYIATQMKAKLEAAAEKDLGQPLDSLEIMNRLKAADPDPQGKNLQFLANMYTKNFFKLQDIEEVRSAIDLFLKHRKTLSVKDLNQLRDIKQLYSVIEPIKQGSIEQPTSKRQQEKGAKESAIKLMQTPNLTVVIPKTFGACEIYSRNTKWCTSQESMFDFYTAGGALYIIIANIQGKTQKFQLHVESGEFKNEKDNDVSKKEIAALSQLPEYTEFLKYLIKKYYRGYLSA